ncbi:MAG: tail fiber domain-containing protein [Acidobacteriota bacterium]
MSTRDTLKLLFKNGARPSEDNFANLIDSFVNKSSDGVSFDADGNLLLNRGVRLGDSAGTAAGGLRFNSNQLQVFTNGAWVNVSGGGGGAFQSPPTGAAAAAAVAYNGNVGIGNFPAGPTFRLEVPLGANTGTGEQVRFGNVVCANGSQVSAGAAVFSHRNHASTTNFALRQGANGAVQINAAAGQAVSVSQGGGQVNFGVSATGKVIVGGDNDLPGSSGEALQVSGTAFKTSVGTVWVSGSDARIKEDVRDFELGLSELCRVRPVRFRYNGRAGTKAGEAGVGVLGQEIEEVFPETIRRVSVPDEPGLDDMRVFDASALTFALINAVKELAARVEHLEQALAAATASAVPALK